MDAQQAEQRYRDYCAFEGYDPYNPPHSPTCNCPECVGEEPYEEDAPQLSPVAQGEYKASQRVLHRRLAHLRPAWGIKD